MRMENEESEAKIERNEEIKFCKLKLDAIL